MSYKAISLSIYLAVCVRARARTHSHKIRRIFEKIIREQANKRIESQLFQQIAINSATRDFFRV